MVTDADRLLAAGAELTIAGHTFHVRYTPRSLKMLEDEFGSIYELNEQLKQTADGKGKIITLTFAVLAMGLQHETVDGQRITEEWLLDNGNLRDLPAYTEAYTAAFAEAFPEADPTMPAKPANGSTGHLSSGSLSRSSTAVRASSGKR